jgi:NAD+ kinase
MTIMTSCSRPDIRESTLQQLADNTLELRDSAKCIGKALIKLKKSKTCMVVCRSTSPSFVVFTRELARSLMDQPCPVSVLVESRLKQNPIFAYNKLITKQPHYKDMISFWTPEYCASNSEAIDFIITLGGDGTILYTAWLFQHSQVPPVLPFHLGSLGFLTVFNIRDIAKVLDGVVGCIPKEVRINLRMRLACTVWRAKQECSMKTASTINVPAALLDGPDEDTLQDRHKLFTSLPNIETQHAVPTEKFHILNDLVVDRGPSAYMSQLELFADDRHLTTSQADGLVIATPTGSTAYSVYSI